MDDVPQQPAEEQPTGDAEVEVPVLGEAAVQDAVLEDLRSAVNYRRWVAGLAAPHLGEHPVEIGSGRGDYALEWVASDRRVTVSEADPARLAALRTRFADDPRIDVLHLPAPFTRTGDHSAAVAINVLEHITDHVGALRSFAGLVRPGGRVVVFVPAFPLAMSDFDRTIGHARRYRRRTLEAAARDAGLTVEVCHHVNLLGLLAWIVLMRLLGGRPKEGALLTVFDRLVVPVLARIEARVRPPFGQSLLLVARVPDV